MSDHIETRLIHAGEPRILGSITVPVFQTAMYEFGGEAAYHDLKYIRLNNTPNHDAVHAKLASLEGTEAALVTAQRHGRDLDGAPHRAPARRSPARPGVPLRRNARPRRAGPRAPRHRVRHDRFGRGRLRGRPSCARRRRRSTSRRSRTRSSRSPTFPRSRSSRRRTGSSPWSTTRSRARSTSGRRRSASTSSSTAAPST